MKIILETLAGSTLHGTSVDDGLEDIDLIGVCIEDPTAKLCGEWDDGTQQYVSRDTWVERTKPEGVRSEAGDTDRTIYGLMKYVKLALNGNPTILLPLFAQGSAIKVCTLEGHELRGLAHYIISKRCGAAFLGYMQQQRERMIGTRGQMNVTRPELISKYGYDTKYAGHLVRLGYQGIEVMLSGGLTLPMKWAERQHVIDVRTGRFMFEEVLRTVEHVEHRLKDAILDSELPERPDTRLVMDWAAKRYMDHWRSL